MIDKQELLRLIRHLNAFNNTDCPEWVIRVIEGMKVIK